MASIYFSPASNRWIVAWTRSDGRRIQRRFRKERDAMGFAPDDERTSRRSMAPAEVRFAERHRVDGNGCWTWTHHKTGDGYAQMSVGGTPTMVHRWSYEAHVAPIPDGMQIDHLCRNRACVNPAHLEPVSPRANVRRSRISQASINASKTHCPEGHPYDDANTYPHGPDKRWRGCRACNNSRSKSAHARRRANAAQQVQ